MQLEPNRSSRSNSKERLHTGSKERPTSHSSATNRPSSAAQEKTQLRVTTDLLSADIQGILDDLQLDCEVAEKEDRARKRSRGGIDGRRGRGGSGSQTRTAVSTWGTTAAANTSSTCCRSASPTARQSDTINTANKGHKRRHYDADTVRQYIVRQQEERKRRQAEEKREMKEEAERRNRRLQELYKKQREVAKTVPPSAEALMAPVQKRLQETYTKLLQEDAQLNEEATQRLPVASSQMVIYTFMKHAHNILIHKVAAHVGCICRPFMSLRHSVSHLNLWATKPQKGRLHLSILHFQLYPRIHYAVTKLSRKMKTAELIFICFYSKV